MVESLFAKMHALTEQKNLGYIFASQMATDRRIAIVESPSIKSDQIFEALQEVKHRFPDYLSERKYSAPIREAEEAIDGIQSQIANEVKSLWYLLPDGPNSEGINHSYKDGYLDIRYVEVSLDKVLPVVKSPVRLNYHMRLTDHDLFHESEFVLSVNDSSNSFNLQVFDPWMRVSFADKPGTFFWVSKNILGYQDARDRIYEGRSWKNLLQQATLLKVVGETEAIQQLRLRQRVA